MTDLERLEIAVKKAEEMWKLYQIRRDEVVRRQTLALVESYFSATNYHSPEAGRELVNSIDVYAWKRIISGEAD